ncbi:AHH domain-containing protein [Sphingobium yanoikuyae]|uniref:AHH domain-containing protein n=1 Tax=Sphingobium yanoikuyae TaxID=13690 RepID=UPI0022DD0E80|nr:AHH domain-containing protein [Sphingobium yanoikuyae]WBQ17644.1 AHH domain-containing protein [Sphingobium yanoikuyae]
MADNDFPRGNENPQFRVVDEDGHFFFSPADPNRSNKFQGHHINPNNIVDRQYDPFLDDDSDWNTIVRLFNGLRSVGYQQNDPDRNRAWLPTSVEDALRLGAVLHDTNHNPYDRTFPQVRLLRDRRARCRPDYRIWKCRGFHRRRLSHGFLR